jgi:galactokinase
VPVKQMRQVKNQQPSDEMKPSDGRVDIVTRLFAERFGLRTGLMIVRSPGRVNLIGEHTDYNEGFVLPAAVNRAIIFAIAPRNDNRIILASGDLNQDYEATTGPMRQSGLGWPDYILGVVDQLQKSGHALRGFECAFGGDIPIGAGLSSSAALECGVAFALNELFGLALAPMELVKLAQRAENEFVGVRCGIMDQFTNMFGKKNRVVRLDCRSLEYTYVPFERHDIRIVLCDTKVRRQLASSEYNVRRRQCETGVSLLQRYDSGIRSLRDVAPALLETHRKELEPEVYRRCAYVLSENARVLAACDDLTKNDFTAVGNRMYASHEGLRDEYQVSCPELDLLVEIAARVPGVLGARMMGAGFGGCTINLVEEHAVDAFAATVGREYRERAGKDPAIHVCAIETGTEQVLPPPIATH